MSNINQIKKETMNLVIAGHVDHGKSTVIGRMLADTGSLPEGKLDQVKRNCEKNSKPFEYAFLIDALKDEQSQGITIDAARVFFKTEKRNYIILDAPGHIEFLKNMITGAARAECALLVIDAEEGVQENSRRHGYMMSMLGIKQIAVIVNKMDLVDYSQERFENIKKEYSEFLKDIDVKPDEFIPVSAFKGDNIAIRSANMTWYKGVTVLEMLDLFKKEKHTLEQDFRMPFQDVYKFTKFGDSRRVVVGTPTSGKLEIGDEVIFYPSGKKSKVKTIEEFNVEDRKQIKANNHAAFSLEEQIYITRGEMACKVSEKNPNLSTRLMASIFWLGHDPMILKKEYYIKLGTAKVPVRIEKIVKTIDASDLSAKEKTQIERHDVAQCVLKLTKPMAYDIASKLAITSRFVIVDDYEIRGGGIIQEALEDSAKWVRDKVVVRDFKWQKSMISSAKRSEKYNQRPTLVIITGEKDSGKKPLAKALENRLFEDGKIVYFLGIGNVLYGVDADIKNKEEDPKEHIRRLAEIAYIMIDSGAILIVTATMLDQEDLEIIKATVESDKIEVVWMGESVKTDINVDTRILNKEDIEENVGLLKSILEDKGIIFKPW